MTAVLGATITDAAGDVLTIPPGAFKANTPVMVTAISQQGPRTPFPPGWVPLGIVDIETPEPFDPPATLALVDRSGAAAGKEAVLARYDVPSAAWLALATVTIPANSPAQLAGITGSGQVALLLPDTGDGAPAPAVPGAPLAAGSAVPIPDNAVASGVVRPSVGRANDPTPAMATITVSANTPLRSGTPLRGDFMELFTLHSGGRVAPQSTSQDLFAYRAPGDATGRTLTAAFPMAPSRTFGLGDLTEGTITVDLLRSQVVVPSLVGSTGGGVQASDGSRVLVPPGALASDVPITLRHLDAATFPVAAPPGFALLGGLELDLAGVTASSSLTLTLAGAAPLVPTGSQVVVAEVQSVLGQDRLVLVALARIDGDALTTVTAIGGVTLPGIRTGGRYGFYRLDGALAVVAGTARDESGRRDGHVIELEGLPFVSVTDATGVFALVTPSGSFVLVATGALIHDHVRVTGTTGTPLPDIVITATPPRVEQITVRLPKLAGNFAGPIVLLDKPAPVIDDDANGASSGNGNGQIEAGERIELTLTVRNDGTVAVTGGFLALSVRGPAGPLAVDPPTLPVGTLPPDAPVAVGPFVFTVPSGVNPALLRYTLSYATAGGLANVLPFELPLGVEHPNVPVGSEVAVRFSEPVVTASLDGAVRLEREDSTGLVPIETVRLVSGDGTVVTLRPLATLAEETVYRVTLTGAITDLDGRALANAPVVERFRTEKRTPPAPIDPGRIEVSVPDANGLVTITGTPGTVNPDDTVIALNETTGFSAVATVNADGSFVVRVRAGVTDQLSIIVRDRNGNEIKVDPGPFVRRDPATGAVVSVVIGRNGGTVTSPDGIRLTVPAGALAGATELKVSRATDAFALPADIAADSGLAAAFAALFKVVARVQVNADVRQFAGPVHLALPPPPGATPGDLFLVVRTRTVTVGGLLADLNAITGLTAAQHPAQTLERLEVLDSATVKSEGGTLVLSTDSPPFSRITGPGIVTLLQVTAPLTFLAGEVRRDTVSGFPVAGAVIQSLPGAAATMPFAAVTDSLGRFVVADAGAGGPYATGAVVSSRLDVTDPDFGRVIRRTVRGIVGPPAPPNTVIAQLVEPFVLPIALPPAFVAVLGDIEPPAVAMRLEGPSLVDNFSRVGDPLTVTVTAKDNDAVTFVALEVDQGNGFAAVPLVANRTFTFTPTVEAVITFRVQARDRSGNVTFAEARVRTVAAAPGAPLIPGPLPGLPVLIEEIKKEIPFDGDIIVSFSEPIDPSSVNQDTVRVSDPEGNPIKTNLSLENGGTLLRITPKRNLRLGAPHPVDLSASIRDLIGEFFPGITFNVTTLYPVQVETEQGKPTIPLSNVEAIALITSDVLVAINHPSGVSMNDVGAIHTFKVRDEMGRLLIPPLQLTKEGEKTTGRPLSLAIHGNQAFVGNRFLGSIATLEPFFFTVPSIGNPLEKALAGCIPDPLSISLRGFIPKSLGPIDITTSFSNPVRSIFEPSIVFCLTSVSIPNLFPRPPSNLEVYDLTDPNNPKVVGINVINLAAPDLWNPNTWPDQVEVTQQGVAVLNFEQNIEFFTPNAQPTSQGVAGRVRGSGQTLGHCQGGVDDDEVCVKDLLPLVPGTQECHGAPCIETTEFLGAAFFDVFAVTLEKDGVRIISTLSIGDPLVRERTIQKLSTIAGTFGARIGAVSNFEWKEGKDNHKTDLAFIATNDGQLIILGVRDQSLTPPITPSSPRVLSVLQETFGNMSFDTCRGLAYLHGLNGEFHVIDFNDPFAPIELNAGANAFHVQNLGSRVNLNSNVNRDGMVYLAGDTGVVVVQVGLSEWPKFPERLACHIRVEIDINNTHDPHDPDDPNNIGGLDDIVRAKTSIENRVLRPKVNVIAKVIGSPSKDIDIQLISNPPGKLHFHDAANAQDEGSLTKKLRLPKNGSPVSFMISGEEPSEKPNDVLIEAFDETTGVKLGYEDLTVFYFDPISMTVSDLKGPYTIDIISRSGFSTLPKTQAVDLIAKVTLKPNLPSENCKVPQLANLMIGIVQNVTSFNHIDEGDSPTISCVGVPAEVAGRRPVPAQLRGVAAGNGTFLDIVKGSTPPIYDSSKLRPVCPVGGSSENVDTPGSGPLSTFDNRGTIVTYNITHASLNDSFRTWAVLFDTNPDNEQISPLLEIYWTLNADSSTRDQQKVIPFSSNVIHDPQLNGTLANEAINASQMFMEIGEPLTCICKTGACTQ